VKINKNIKKQPAKRKLEEKVREFNEKLIKNRKRCGN
jgi:hypothetical protein